MHHVRPTRPCGGENALNIPKGLRDLVFEVRGYDKIVVPTALTGDFHAIADTHGLRIMEQVSKSVAITGRDEE